MGLATADDASSKMTMIKLNHKILNFTMKESTDNLFVILDSILCLWGLFLF